MKSPHFLRLSDWVRWLSFGSFSVLFLPTLLALLLLPSCFESKAAEKSKQSAKQAANAAKGNATEGKAALLHLGGKNHAALLFGRAKDSVTLDPAEASDGESSKVIDQMFEGLVSFSSNKKEPARIIPCLAVDWEQSADRRSWTFELRTGVRFHDGTPFDAEAVRFTFNRLLRSDHPQSPLTVPYRSNFQVIESIEVLGPHKVRFFLSEPSVVFLPNLAMFCASIVSPTAVRKMGRRFSLAPVGTGPFRFVKWKKDVRIHLTRNKAWWGDSTPGGIQNLVFVQIADGSSRLAQLRAGEIQMADNLQLEDVPILEKDKGLLLKKNEGMNVCYVAMNNQKAPFTDPRVRRAFSMAVDRSRIITRAYSGFGLPAKDLLPPFVPGHQGQVAPGMDLIKAKALLKEAGFDPKAKLELWVMNNPRPYLPRPKRVAEILRDCFAKIGVKVTIKAYDWASYIQKLQGGEHQMALVGWTSDNGDPDNFFTPILGKESIGGTNFIRMRHAGFEHLLQSQREEAVPFRRHKLIAKMESLLGRECPLIPLAFSPGMFGVRKEVLGFVAHPLRYLLEGVRLAE